ncbi:hypothetical protein T05_9778 [Trichinella murrelli]|uniref:Uncharacterized protein n=1 Tax=Trichinella murrelli TaxID=144512 RepID=A0A0V0TWF7_9BILA|nr:hypothetical protein T05_9778 [Trichinella murrelli]
MLKLTSRPRRQALNSRALATLLNNLVSILKVHHLDDNCLKNKTDTHRRYPSDNIPAASKYCQIIENFNSMSKHCK